MSYFIRRLPRDITIFVVLDWSAPFFRFDYYPRENSRMVVLGPLYITVRWPFIPDVRYGGTD